MLSTYASLSTLGSCTIYQVRTSKTVVSRVFFNRSAARSTKKSQAGPSFIVTDYTIEASLSPYLSGNKRSKRKGRPVAKFEQLYELGKEIGHGGYATAYIATHRDTRLRYACKVIDMEHLDALHRTQSGTRNGYPRSQLENELRVLKELQYSPHVARFQDAFQCKKLLYIVMELCEGGTIAEAVNKIPADKGLAYKEAMIQSLMRSVLQTLAVCHATGILHRDVKPDNFLLLDDEEGSRIKAVDFGLSAFFSQGLSNPECTGLKLQGTPCFIPPEALQDVFCPAGDIWGAGIVAYHLLTGKFPFDDRSATPDVNEVFHAIVNEPLELDIEELQGYSQEAKSFIRQLLQRDPKARPTARDALHHPWVLKGYCKPESTANNVFCISELR